MKRFKKNKLIVTSVVSILGVCGLVVVLNNVDTLMPQLANADDTAYRLNINTALTVDENNQATVKTTLGNDVVFEVEGDYTLDSGVITLKEGASLTNVNRIQGMSEITVNTDGKSLRMGLGLQADSMSLEEHYLLEDATVHMMNPTYDFVTLVATQDTTIESIDIGYSCVTRAVLNHGEDWIEIDSLAKYRQVMEPATNLEAKIYLSTNIDFNGEQLSSMPGEFKGTFDGNGYSVYNYLGRSDTNSRMFNLLNGATIQNVVISGTLPNSGGGTMVAYGANESITNQSTISNTVARANLDNGAYDGPYGMFVYLARNNNIRIENSHAELFIPATYSGNAALFVKAADGDSQTEVSNVTYGITGAGSEGKSVAGNADGVTNTGKTVIHNEVLDPELVVSVDKNTLNVDETATLTVGVENLPDTVSSVTYTVTSENEDVVSVTDNNDNTYTLTALKAGSSTITVSTEIESETYTQTVTIEVVDLDTPKHTVNLSGADPVFGEEHIAKSDPGSIYYWNDQNWVSSNVTVNQSKFENNEYVIEYTSTGSCWYGFQFFYEAPEEADLVDGTKPTIKITINSSVEGDITINDVACHLNAGNNTLTAVSAYAANSTDADLSVQFGILSPQTMITSGTFKISAIEFYY